MTSAVSAAELRRQFGAFLNRFDEHAPRPLDADHLHDFSTLLLRFAEDLLEASFADDQPLSLEHFDELAELIEQSQDRAVFARDNPIFPQTQETPKCTT